MKIQPHQQFVRLSRLLLSGLLSLWAFSSLQAEDEYDLLRKRWAAMLTGGADANVGDGVMRKKAEEEGKVAQEAWKKMEKGAERILLWEDRPLGGKSANLFLNYERLESLALAYATPGSGLQGNDKLAKDVVAALDWLGTNHYNPNARRYGNWWEWEIGIPLSLNNSIALLHPLLTADQITNWTAAIDFFQPDPHMSGANRLWESEVIILRGINGKNGDKIAQGIAGLDKIFPYNRSWGDGYYEDGSFIQHGRVPYNGGYGKSLFRDIVDVLYLLQGSKWQVSNPEAKNVFRWAYDSYEPFIYKGQMMDMVRGREIAQPSRNPNKIGHQTIHPFVRLSQFAAPEDAKRYKSMIKYWILSDTYRDFYQDVPADIAALARKIVEDPNIVPRGELVKHQRSPMMARVVHLRPGFGFGISMNSAKVGNYESINSTNARGWYTSDGMTYLYNADLGQYADHFWPTVNSYRLPGTTVDTVPRKTAEGNNVLNPNTWAGGCDLKGQDGIAGMHLKGFNVSLTAKKSWFMFGDKIVALGADIDSSDNRSIETIVENRKLKVDGKNVLVVNGSSKPLNKGWTEKMEAVSWIHLEGNVPGSDIGYFFPTPSVVYGLREEREDKWSNICSASGDRDDTLVKNNFVTLWFDHGKSPSDASYAYVLLPNKTPEEVRVFSQTPRLVILENSAEAQAVQDEGMGIVGVNFWNDAAKTVGGITCSKKASVMTRIQGNELEVAISDPTQVNTGTIELDLDRGVAAALSSDPGVKVLQLGPVLKFSVAVKGAMGKTFSAKFSLAESSKPDADPKAP